MLNCFTLLEFYPNHFLLRHEHTKKRIFLVGKQFSNTHGQNKHLEQQQTLGRDTNAEKQCSHPLQLPGLHPPSSEQSFLPQKTHPHIHFWQLELDAPSASQCLKLFHLHNTQGCATWVSQLSYVKQILLCLY